MVIARSRRGGSTLGCLVTVALVAAAMYVMLLFARPWFRNQQFRDEMKSAGRYASTISDSTIRARLVARADSLDLPREAKRIRIRRTGEDGVIRISAAYEVTVMVPIIGPRIMSFEPMVEEPL